MARDHRHVAANLHLLRAQLDRFLQRRDQRAIFRDIVRRPPDEASERDDGRPIRCPHDNPDPCGTGIAARASVEFKRERFVH